MSQQYYECHITFDSKKPEVIEMDVGLWGWKFSCINGDPVLGDGLKCYGTKHFPAKMPEKEVITAVRLMRMKMKQLGHTVLRDKVELVVYDSKLVHIGE